MSSATASTRRPIVLLVLAEALILALLAFAVIELGLGWTGALLIGLVAALFPLLLVRVGERHSAAQGGLSPATKRFNRRMISASILYVATLLGGISLHDRLGLDGPVLWLLALLPAGGVIAMVVALGRLLAEEDDEYLRARLVERLLTGLGVLLVAATLWGFLEIFGLVPHVPAFVAFPVFALGLGLSCLIRRR